MTPFRIAATAGLVGTSLVLSSTALAQVPPVPSVSSVEALCPGQEGNPLQFGTPEDALDPASLARLEERARAAGFEKVEPQFTSWSGKMLGVELIRDVPDGAALDQWGESFHDRLTKAGWIVSEDTFMAGAEAHYEKEIAGDAEPELLAIEVSLHGVRRGITILCADAGLQVENQDEIDGVLAEGSPRPVPPPPQPALEEFLARLDCEDPALLDAFAKAMNLDDAGALVETRLAPEEVTAQADYQFRTVTWLRWRMLGSGKVPESVLWDIEEQVREQHPLNFEDDLLAMAKILEEVMEAEKAKDPAKLCAGYKGMVAYLFNQSAHEERSNSALAVAYEAEAARRGIPLD